MAGTVTFTYDEGHDGAGLKGHIQKVTVDWTSDASGDADGTSRKIVGRLIKGVTDPGDSPTDNYDIVITDEEGVNVLGNCFDDLVDRDTTNTEEVYFQVSNLAATDPAGGVHPVVCDTLTITVSNAGNAKSGQLILYVGV